EGRPWFSYPLEPGQLGHEAWGRIDAIGADVTSLAVGDRVAMMSNHGYAAYDVADADAVVVLPDVLSDQPVPGEPLGCAMNIFGRAEVGPEQTVADLGIGCLGALLTQLWHARGARVRAMSRRPWSLKLAPQVGAHDAIPRPDRDGVIKDVAAL